MANGCKKKRIVVTGSSGFVGQVVCKKLNIPKEDRYDIIEGKDLASSSIIKEASEADIIVHLAAISGIKQCEDDKVKAAIINADVTKQLAEYSKKNGARRFIFASTSAVYGEAQEYKMTESHPVDPRSYYGKTKLEAERIIDLSDKSFEVVILRKSNLYGYGLTYKGITVLDRLIERFLLKEPLTIVGTGSQRRDFLHVIDAARVYVQLAQTKKTKSGVYNLGGGQNPSIRELAEIVNDIGEAIFGYRVGLAYEDNREEVLWHDFVFDFSKAMSAFQFKPIFTLDDVIKERMLMALRTKYA